MIQRVVNRQMWLFSIKVLGVFSLMTFLIDWVKEQKNISSGSYYFYKSIIYTIGILPSRWNDMYVFIGFLAIAAFIYTTHQRGELNTFYSLGLTPKRLLKSLLIFSITWYVVFFVNDDVSSWLENRVKAARVEWLSNGKAIKHDGHFWLTEQTEHGINIIDFDAKSGEKISNFNRYYFKNDHMYLLEHAETGQVISPGLWRLKNITQYHFTESTPDQTVLDDLEWQTSIDLDIMMLSQYRPSLLTLKNLFELMNHTVSGLPVMQYSEAFWQRLMMPIKGCFAMWSSALASIILISIPMNPLVFFMVILLTGITVLQVSGFIFVNLHYCGLSWNHSLWLTTILIVVLAYGTQYFLSKRSRL
ncbi:MAG: LptF/LptG family permease [Candidatus Comchoanobacterales bacterium]